nr:Gag-Pol polyprotein [Tanacetum cinerariifolium]
MRDSVTMTALQSMVSMMSEGPASWIEADDQAIQTILLGLPEDIYAAEKKAKLFNEWERFASNEGESIKSYYHRFLKLMNDLKRNKHFPEKIASNLKFLNNLQPEWSRYVTIVHQTKDLHTADYTKLYDFLKQYAGQNARNLNGYNAVQNVKYQVIQNAVQNPRVQNDGIQNQIGNEDMNYDTEQIEQNNEDVDLAKERELLASLIQKLKCEIDETKNRNTLLETSNKVLVEKLKSEIADFKNKNKSLTEANNKLSEENDLLYADFKKSKAELQRRNNIEYASEMELECAKVKGDLLSYKMEYERSYNKYTQTINDLNQTVSEMKDKLSAHQDTISILKQKKDAQIKLYKTREDKEIEKVIDLENKVKILDNIVYKTGQSVQTINMHNNKCRTSFAKPEYLKKAKQANPRLYDIGCYNDNLALMLSPESDEVV